IAVPAMSRIRGLKRVVAAGVAKTFLRIAQLITRDQRTFNLTALDGLRLLYDRARDDAAQIVALRRDFDAVSREFRDQVTRLAQLRTSLSLQERRVDAIADSGGKQSEKAAPHPDARIPAGAGWRLPDATYLHFEDEFRGSRETIKERAKVY